MKKYILTSIIFCFILYDIPAMAEQVRQLSWEDLVPAKLLADDPLSKLTRNQQDMVYWVINMLETLPKRSPDTEEYYKEVDEAMPALKKYGIDIKKVLAKRKEIRTSVVKELNGKMVRIPGYLLPLEVSGAKVTEFLLVPYVGACIHVPPPPPNQIIYVKAAKNNGYNSKKIFEPVWVTGVISVKSMSKNLFLVDGSAGVNIGYSMQADQIEPYKK
jgi:hypothetical protein